MAKQGSMLSPIASFFEKNRLIPPKIRSMPQSVQSNPQKNWLILSTVAWLLLLVASISIQFRYDSLPGTASASKSGWPATSLIERSPATNTLVMLLHPRCPCSRASLQQVATMKASGNSFRSVFLFYAPSSFAKGWEKTDIWNQASEISDAQLVSDIDGREAQKFGGFTSGQTYIFDRYGNLRYAGGLTEGRGHQGECKNLEAAVNALSGNKPASFGAVYGCPIVVSRNAQL